MVLVVGSAQTELQRKRADLTDLRPVKRMPKCVKVCPSSFKLKGIFFFLVNEEGRTKCTGVSPPEPLELGKRANQVSSHTDQELFLGLFASPGPCGSPAGAQQMLLLAKWETERFRTCLSTQCDQWSI